MNEGGTIAIKEYCNKHELNFESKLSINDDLLHDLIKKPEDKAFLLGVQKPESMNTEKLYFCAVMEFEL